ncbi:DUF5081 family protein [Listeria fleischmannii]|uniref:DUF5081 family protein n=1 Tax=Listeria fleischmannii TaxID=1069827 RepID=UPI00162467A0|nr:DUF5081 family protein [Listeria fleischmannii]MBC1417827.1 DUF5081 family protein [Listeria fleischmannii]
MKTEMVDVFSPVELYLLLSPYKAKHLFGVPNRAIYQLKGEEVFEEGFQALQEKGIFDEDKKLSDFGGILIDSLFLYHQSEKYVRINQMMFGFSKEFSNEVFVLIEVEKAKQYRFIRMNKIFALKMLYEEFPLISREPKITELDLMKEKLSIADTKRVAEAGVEREYLSIEFFQTKESNYEQLLAILFEEKLIVIDVVKDEYTRMGQHYFLKKIFDEMGFPYKEGK